MSSQATMSPGEGPPAKKRSYGASCLACREKKISCNGVRPSCKGCIETNEECQYISSARPLRKMRATSNVPYPSIINELQTKVDQLERKLGRVEELLAVPLASVPSSPRRNTVQLDALATSSQMQALQASGPSSHNTGASSAGLTGTFTPGTGDYNNINGGVVTNGTNGTHGTNGSGNAEKSNKWRLTVDQSGNVVYHGLTSLDQAEDMTDLDLLTHSAPASAGMTDHAFSPLFQALAVSKHISVAPELGTALIDAFFAYQVTAILDRAVFLRDMALGGKFFSEFLLMCVYTVANRQIDGLDDQERKTQGDIFARLARDMLTTELAGASKITTAQGLLLLSGRECEMGNVSQGWNFAGLAFRLIHDLGIHLNPDMVAGSTKLSVDDLATRDRLFWSAFVWDKVLSLACGREPSFFPRKGRDPSTIPDISSDEEIWHPYYRNLANCPPQLVNYVYMPKRRIEAFRLCANLMLILHDLIVEVYSSESELADRERLKFLAGIRFRLENLWAKVPERIKYKAGESAPPPWVFMLLMLYHSSWILLYRPFFEPRELAEATSPSVVTCLEHSALACSLSRAYCSFFDYRCPYLATYSCFVAASFDVSILKSERYDAQLDALNRVRIWLEDLSQVASHGNNIKRSVQSLYGQVVAILSANLTLGATEAGQWILTQFSQGGGGMVFASPANSGDGQIALDFSEILGPGYLY